MGKWLIRKVDGKIIGPISQEKAVQFYRDQSFSENDELHGDNGHWFYIHEEDLLIKYLLESNFDKEISLETPAKFPGDDDLTYPDHGPQLKPVEGLDDITLIYEKNEPEEKREVEEKITFSTASNLKEKPLVQPSPPKAKPLRDDRYLIFIFVLLFIILGFLINKYLL